MKITRGYLHADAATSYISTTSGVRQIAVCACVHVCTWACASVSLCVGACMHEHMWVRGSVRACTCVYMCVCARLGGGQGGGSIRLFDLHLPQEICP